MIWSKRNRGPEPLNGAPRRRSSLWRTGLSRPLSLGSLLLLTSACGQSVSVSPPAAPPPGPPAAVSRKPEPLPSASAGLGLQPLPSPAQVSAAVALGRPDPFLDPRPRVVPPPPGVAAAGPASRGAPAAAAAPNGYATPARPAAPPAAPADFQFNGLVQSSGRTEAIVQYKGEAGTVAVGDRGGAANPLLPAGWRVESIDSRAGVLRLHTGRGVVRIPLSEEQLG